MAEPQGPDGDFYGSALAQIHHARFGELPGWYVLHARKAAR
jgi:hypothetical protein